MNLVALSGGYDSTAMLKLLLERGEPCSVHHVCLANFWHDEEVEAAACRQIVQHLRRRHEFDYTTSRLEYLIPGWTGQDNIQALVMVLSEAERLLSRDNQLELSICFGFNRDDSTFAQLNQRLGGVFDGYFRGLPPEIRRPELRYPLIDLGKADILALLPDELVDICITCPRPIGGQPCGKCKKCRMLAEALERRRSAA